MGPSSIMHALVLSGLNAQQFSFHGYLPREIKDLKVRLLELQRVSQKEGSTQMWIEAPYRTSKMFHQLLETLGSDTYLCLASNLTMPTEKVETKTIQKWKKSTPDLKKQPAIFLISSEKACRKKR